MSVLLTTKLLLPNALFSQSLHQLTKCIQKNIQLATFPYPFPQAPLIPYWSLSAPAQLSILLILVTCHGWTLHLKWKFSLPAFLIKYLLAAIRAASRDSDEIYSFSYETMWTTAGKFSTSDFLFPPS